jgi:hypothetical protein
MALTRSIFHGSPQAMLLSIRGYNFGFSRELSPRTAELVQQAIEMIIVTLEGA